MSTTSTECTGVTLSSAVNTLEKVNPFLINDSLKKPANLILTHYSSSQPKQLTGQKTCRAAASSSLLNLTQDSNQKDLLQTQVILKKNKSQSFLHKNGNSNSQVRLSKQPQSVLNRYQSMKSLGNNENINTNNTSQMVPKFYKSFIQINKSNVKNK